MIHFGDAIQNQTNLFTIGDPIELVLSFKKEEDQDLDINIKEVIEGAQKNKTYIIPKKTTSIPSVKTIDNSTTLKISNIGDGMTDEDIRDIFGEFGSIKRINFPKSKKTRQLLGYAFVTFESRQEAENVINNKKRYIFNHCVLDICWAL